MDRVEWGKIRIKPYLDRLLRCARGVYLLPVEKIVSAWQYRGEKLSIEILCGGEAEMELPDGDISLKS